MTDRLWAVLAVLVLAAMTITALADFETSGWLLIPVAGFVLYWLIRQGVAHGVRQAERDREREREREHD